MIYGKKIFLYCSIVSLWQVMISGVGTTFDHRGIIGRIYKEDYLHCYTENMKALSHVGLENKVFFYVFPL